MITANYSRSFKLLIEGLDNHYLFIKHKKEKYFSLFVMYAGKKVFLGRSTSYEVDEEVRIFSFYNGDDKEQNRILPYNQFWELKPVTALELSPV
jgi:hypothetical protein